MAIEEAGEDSLAEKAHQERGVPFRQGEEAAVRGEAAVGCEQVEMGVPLQEVSRGGDRDDEAGTQVASGPTADERAPSTVAPSTSCPRVVPSHGSGTAAAW